MISPVPSAMRGKYNKQSVSEQRSVILQVSGRRSGRARPLVYVLFLNTRVWVNVSECSQFATRSGKAEEEAQEKTSRGRRRPRME